MATSTDGRRTVTIAEIAALAGVSVPTVSKVLNGRADVAPPPPPRGRGRPSSPDSRVRTMTAEAGFSASAVIV